MGFNSLKTTEPLWGGSLLFTTKFPEIPGTHFIVTKLSLEGACNSIYRNTLEGWKAWGDLGSTQWFWTRDTCNLRQKVVDKLTKLSNIDFSVECFTADILRDFTKNVKIWLLGGWLSTCHPIQES